MFVEYTLKVDGPKKIIQKSIIWYLCGVIGILVVSATENISIILEATGLCIFFTLLVYLVVRKKEYYYDKSVYNNLKPRNLFTLFMSTVF